MYLHEILPVCEPKTYKLHFAENDGYVAPVDVFAKD